MGRNLTNQQKSEKAKTLFQKGNKILMEKWLQANVLPRMRRTCYQRSSGKIWRPQRRSYRRSRRPRRTQVNPGRRTIHAKPGLDQEIYKPSENFQKLMRQFCTGRRSLQNIYLCSLCKHQVFYIFLLVLYRFFVHNFWEFLRFFWLGKIKWLLKHLKLFSK